MYFDQQCVADMPMDDVCPVEVVDAFVDGYMSGLQIQNFVAMFVSLLALVTFMQLGGIPIARGRVGVFLYVLFTSILVAQYIAQLLSVVMIVAGYMRMRAEFGSCMRPEHHGRPLYASTCHIEVFAERCRRWHRVLE